MATVIIFGPTGSVASVIARTAHEKGCNVVLAMRDTQKEVPGLVAGTESSFKRVQADLKNAESVTAAVKESGATRAFMYAINGTDHMRSTIEAMKAAGIELVVFVSTCSVLGDARDVPADDYVPYFHAQIEVSLEDVFGPASYVTLRPSRFSTAFAEYRKDIKAGHVKLYAPEYAMDYISPADIGRVGGSILANGMRNGENRVFLFGPNQVTLREGVEFIAKTLGQTIQISTKTEAEVVDGIIKRGIPKDKAEYFLGRAAIRPADDLYNQNVGNVLSYSGVPATTLQEWVLENKANFER